MSATIKPGSVVQLKSGGPQMTVEWVDNSMSPPLVACSWFNDKKERKQERFQLVALDLVA